MKRRSDGRLVRTIVDEKTGKRIYFYGKSEKEINKKIFAYTSEEEKGKFYKHLSEAWWYETQERLAVQSIKTYNIARKRAEKEFGNTPIKDIKPKNITVFLKKLAAKGYAQKTISNQKTVINLICEYAIEENQLETNPCASAQMPKDLVKRKRSAASDTDEKTIQETADIWLFPFFALMTGMRKGEILALQGKDIDMEKNLISVTKSVYHNGDRPFIKAPKTEAGKRIVPLLEPLKAVLKKHKLKKNDYIFSDDGKTPLTERRFTTLFKHYRQKTGVECTAHQLRHSFATIAFESNVPLKSVSEILGHKQISTTMDIYTDFRKQAFENAAELLNNSFNKKSV